MKSKNKKNNLIKIKIWDEYGKPVDKIMCSSKDLGKSFKNILKKFN